MTDTITINGIVYHPAKIPLTQWAAAHCISDRTARQLAQTGGLPSAEKIGRYWFVSPSEPHVDRRVTSGAYVGKSRKR